MGANVTPPPSGWSRSLQFRRDGTYSYLESDSAGQHVLCGGRYKVHAFNRPVGASGAEGGLATVWIELDG